MREIMFRGNRLDNGEWVYGNLFVSDTDGGTYILAGSRTVTIEWEVDPSTVGQYTGLKDKNEKRIFEGDIIRLERDLWNGETKKTRKIQIGVVFYDTNTAEFGAKIPGYCSCLTLRRWKGDFNEVIGNIYDNPELR